MGHSDRVNFKVGWNEMVEYPYHGWFWQHQPLVLVCRRLVKLVVGQMQVILVNTHFWLIWFDLINLS